MHPNSRDTEVVVEVRDAVALRHGVVGNGIRPTEDRQQRAWGLTDVRVTDPDGWRSTSRR
ncbi:MAG: hypothetical protein IPH03_07050 [Tetrasphaera sp.]|nr:hypothetical protein [Tetrasphaera sp.]